jgi:hypothetical protein
MPTVWIAIFIGVRDTRVSSVCHFSAAGASIPEGVQFSREQQAKRAVDTPKLWVLSK